MAALKCVPENSSWEEQAGRSHLGMSSGGAEYFSPGRESGDRCTAITRPKGATAALITRSRPRFHNL
jgi:hypothetical protein